MAPPFVLPDLYGGPVSLTATLEQRPALLVFGPGSWSPAMRRQLAELDTACDRLRAAGVDLLMIVSQDLPRLRRALGAHRPRFPVLADERRAVARDYGVYRAISIDGIAISSPAVFLIGRSGAIRFLYVGRRNEDLPDTDGLVSLATWLVRAEEIEEATSSYPTDGEIWLDEQTSIVHPEANGKTTDETAALPLLGATSEAEPATRRRRPRRTKPPVGPTEP